MIIKEYYLTREDGVKLYRSYSDKSFYIRQDQTGTLYGKAIDVENAPYTYTETDIPISVEPSPVDEDIIQKAEAFDYLTGRSGENE